MRWFVGTLGVGWSELLRITRKHFGRNGTETEDNMTLIFWVCVVVVAFGLGMVVPPWVLFPALVLTALLVLSILAYTKKF